MNQNGDQKNLMDCFKGITERFNRVGERLIIKGSVASLPQAGSSLPAVVLKKEGPSGPTLKALYLIIARLFYFIPS